MTKHLQIIVDHQPTSPGLMRISCPFPPVSLQAGSTRKSELQDAIKTALQGETNVFTGAIEVEIVPYYTADYFYEHGHRPDIDNIIKPILDAVKGEHGVLIDDHQVERVQSKAEFDEDADPAWFTVTIIYKNSGWVPRTHKFIDIGGGKCKPTLDRAGQYELGKTLLKSGAPYARGFLQIDRPWFISDVEAAGFEVKGA